MRGRLSGSDGRGREGKCVGWMGANVIWEGEKGVRGLRVDCDIVRREGKSGMGVSETSEC